MHDGIVSDRFTPIPPFLHGFESFVLHARHSFATAVLVRFPSSVDLQHPKNAQIKAGSDQWNAGFVGLLGRVRPELRFRGSFLEVRILHARCSRLQKPGDEDRAVAASGPSLAPHSPQIFRPAGFHGGSSGIS